jgi:hypothetical protein
MITENTLPEIIKLMNSLDTPNPRLKKRFGNHPQLLLHLRSKKENEIIKKSIEKVLTKDDYFKDEGTRYIFEWGMIGLYLTKKERNKAVREYKL